MNVVPDPPARVQGKPVPSEPMDREPYPTRIVAQAQAAQGGLEEILHTLRMEDANQDFFGPGGEIKLKTHLNRVQVVVFSQALQFAREWEIPELSGLIKEIEMHSVSLDRLSRKEWHGIMSSPRALVQRLAQDGREP